MRAFHPIPPSVLGGMGCVPLRRWPSAKGFTLTVQKKKKHRFGTCAVLQRLPPWLVLSSKVRSWKVELGVSQEPAGGDSSTPTKVVMVETAEKPKQTWEWETLNSHRWFFPRTGRAKESGVPLAFLPSLDKADFTQWKSWPPPVKSNLSAAFLFPNSGGCLRGSGSHFGPSYASPSLSLLWYCLWWVGCDQSSLRNRA